MNNMNDSKAKRDVGARGGSTLVEGPHCYIVTIKCNHKEAISRELLDAEYNRIVKAVPKGDWTAAKTYEEDSNGRMHIHTICEIEGKQPYFKRLQRKGWTINFAEFPAADYHKVLGYCHKNDQSEYSIKQLFEGNNYRFGYHFQELVE